VHPSSEDDMMKEIPPPVINPRPDPFDKEAHPFLAAGTSRGRLPVLFTQLFTFLLKLT
jgi:hypothetical protein